MSSGYYKFTVPEPNNGQTVKTFLRRACGITARSMTLLKYAGMGITRKGVELRAHDKVAAGDVLELTLPPDKNEVLPIKGALDILYEDDYLLLVDKPPFMPVHPTKVHQTDTLANLVSCYQQERGESYTFRALNRLDKDTSGCVLIAKDRIAYSLTLPSVEKSYVAVCEGIITEAGTVDAPIALAEDSKIRRCVRGDGAHAVTHYRPLACGNDHTLLEMKLETGRTHQIRCHMSYIGHPLAGDDMYGGSLRYIDRQALHCRKMQFIHPVIVEEMTFDTGTPQEFTDIIGE